MIDKQVKLTHTLPDGRTIEIETGRLARQAHGSVILKMGKTMLLATIVSDSKAEEDMDFLPLMVEYKEKFASAGKIPGGYLKREGRPSDKEVLVCRLIDRALRPLFPEDYHSNTQVVVNLISHGDEALPDALSCFAASAAIAVSDIPFKGPVSEVRIIQTKDLKWIINPDKKELKESHLDLIVAGTQKNIIMVEGEMKEVDEDTMIEAINEAHKEIKKQVDFQNKLSEAVFGTSTRPNREYNHERKNEKLSEKIKDFCYDKFVEVAQEGLLDRKIRSEKFSKIKESFMETLSEEERKDDFLLSKYLKEVQKEAIRSVVLSKKTRLDGRKTDQVRDIWSEIDYLPGAHGSSIFTRGETQSLTSVTLGNKLDEQIVDEATSKGFSKLMLHYNFPAFSTGEARPNRGTSRREVGHGNLALRSIKPCLPEDNPYTIRMVSDILESNGSSSMATVCAATLALMDAGVKIKRPVSGIAMGLITSGSEYAILSDILGDEDHLGDMDFKVAGTREGITACQMDIKIEGLSFEILKEALNQAKSGRLHILSEMEKTIDTPNLDYKSHTPRITQIVVPKDMIGSIIGPGGKIIQELQERTQTNITIEETEEGGVVEIMSKSKEGSTAALESIKQITAVPEIGSIYKGRVKNIVPFGAFVEFLPGKDGLLHISEIDNKRIENVEDVLSIGDNIEVKLIGKDKNGKFKLSKKALIND